MKELAKDIMGRINELESALLKCEQKPAPVEHIFGEGLYIRKIVLPKDSFAIGHVQNFEHMNVMVRGRVTVLNEDGSTQELKAPMTFQGKPGRKVGFIHEETEWLNIYATNETDVEKLEAKYITKSDSWQEDYKILYGRKLLENKFLHEDYQKMLKEFGVTEEQVRAQTERTEDMTELPHGNYKIKVGDSSIQGKGLFATADIAKGDIIAPARIKDKRTIAGRFTNHSPIPNAMMYGVEGGNIYLVAISPIKGCQGGFDGEEITVNYRQAIEENLKVTPRGDHV